MSAISRAGAEFNNSRGLRDLRGITNLHFSSCLILSAHKVDKEDWDNVPPTADDPYKVELTTAHSKRPFHPFEASVDTDPPLHHSASKR